MLTGDTHRPSQGQTVVRGAAHIMQRHGTGLSAKVALGLHTVSTCLRAEGETSKKTTGWRVCPRIFRVEVVEPLLCRRVEA
jgi:hypothetical protein